MNADQLLAALHIAPGGHLDGIDPETAATIEAAGYARFTANRRWKLTGKGEHRRAEIDASRVFTGAPVGGRGVIGRSPLET